MKQHISIENERDWTFMVYLAGDNNLENFGLKDLREMKKAGSTETVAIVAQFDSMSGNITRRYELTGKGSLDDDCVAELPEVNTGDPNALIDFIAWAGNEYPARHFALVLWNHGSGWKDEDIYRTAGLFPRCKNYPIKNNRGFRALNEHTRIAR